MDKKLIQLAFTQDEYKQLLELASDNNMNITDFMKSKTLPNYKGTPYYIEIAKEKVNLLPTDINFTLPLLFGEDWNKLSRSIKLSIGRDFYRQVNENNIQNIIPTSKDSSNIQVYKKQF